MYGFTLLEVLVSVLVLTTGLLGTAGLYLVSMRNTAESGLRSQATMFATDLTERLRAAAPTGDAAQITAFMAGDLTSWSLKVGQLMPGGGGLLCRDSRVPTAADPTACTNGANDPLVVKVWWRERDARGDNTNAGGTGDVFYLGSLGTFRPQLAFVVTP